MAGIEDAASLSNGDAGFALFFAYLAEAELFPDVSESAARHLDRAQEALAETAMTQSLFSGFTGVAWATEHLNQRIFSADEDPNKEIDDALMMYVSQTPWVDDYDLVAGLVGIGVYALARLPRHGARTLLERIIDRLDETAERGPRGITWHTSPDLLPAGQRETFPDGHYNLGLAHGVPGVIALLGHACAAGIAVEASTTLLQGAIAWLLSQRLRSNAHSMFPATTVPGIDPRPARTAWCYGDPGIAAALLAAARGVGEPEWEREALALALVAAARQPDKTGVVDAGLCHGAAGLAHIFNRLYQTTGDVRLAAAARSWFERALDMREPLFTEPDLLTGVAGVGLALLAAVTAIEPAWDQVFLLSAPSFR